MSMTLPLELQMLICDVLATACDLDGLRRCALISSFLTPHCQKHLFAKVLLSFRHDQGRSVQRLSEIVDNRPIIASYIRTLHVTFGDPIYFHHDSIPRILSRCTKVIYFNLRCRRSHLDNPDWPSTLPEPTLLALESILYSPSLVGLTVFGFNLPMPTFFDRCQPSLKELDIRGVGVIDDSDLTTRQANGLPVSPHRLDVEPLVICGILKARLSRGDFLFDFSALQFLSSYAQCPEDIQRINQALRRAKNLHCLTLTLDGRYSTLVGLFDSQLPCLSTIRHVEAEMTIFWESSLQSIAPFHGLLVELQRFPAQNVLETVELRITLHHDYDWKIVEEDWLSLATSFSKEEFPCLKNVDVTAVVEDWDEEQRGHILVEELADLPTERLDLHFSFNLSPEHNWHWA